VTRWDVFGVGLLITGVGMALVFLTLILVALVIWALSKAFPGKPEAEGEEEEQAEPELLASEAAPVADDILGQVAAVAVALALQAGAARPALALAPAGAVASVAALPWQALTEVDDEEITGEVVQVAGITGSASWKARGRLDGLK